MKAVAEEGHAQLRGGRGGGAAELADTQGRGRQRVADAVLDQVHEEHVVAGGAAAQLGVDRHGVVQRAGASGARVVLVDRAGAVRDLEAGRRLGARGGGRASTSSAAKAATVLDRKVRMMFPHN